MDNQKNLSQSIVPKEEPVTTKTDSSPSVSDSSLSKADYPSVSDSSLSKETKKQKTRRQEIDRVLHSILEGDNQKIKLKNLAKLRNLDVDIDRIYDLYQEHKRCKAEVEVLQASQNALTKKIGKSKPSSSLIEEGEKLKKEIRNKIQELRLKGEGVYFLAVQIPNVVASNVPKGNETKNEVLRKEGESKKFDFKPRDNVELGELLDIIDIPRAVKVSGSRFGYLKNEGALLEFALVQFVMEKLVKEGFIPVIPPALIKKEITEGLGYWYGGGNENYYLVRDYELEGYEKGEPIDLYLVGTGEHSVVPMHNGEVFEEKELPKKYVAFSPCFRREAGSYGKDTRGILRVHQFDKVEMIAFVKPENDKEELKKLVELAEEFMKSLGLPYQVVQLASEDLSLPAAETIDIETWIPSQERYRETHSISTTTDFQAKRLNIRYQDGSEKKYVHILNGTAFAIGRTIIAILENYQQEDGRVLIPKVLQKYTGFSEIKPRKPGDRFIRGPLAKLN